MYKYTHHSYMFRNVRISVIMTSNFEKNIFATYHLEPCDNNSLEIIHSSCTKQYLSSTRNGTKKTKNLRKSMIFSDFCLLRK